MCDFVRFLCDRFYSITGRFWRSNAKRFQPENLVFNVFSGIWLVAGARFELRKPSGGWVRVKVMSLKLIKG
jgi:hypothetical protein